jgi:iron complex transport system ATP-binding protein
MAFGNGNFSNLVTVKEAAKIGKKVIVIEGENIESRDYSGGKATKIYKEIVSKGVIVVNEIDGIIDVLKK